MKNFNTILKHAVLAGSAMLFSAYAQADCNSLTSHTILPPDQDATVYVTLN